MNPYRIVLTSVALLIVTVFSASAWNSTGHKIVAAVAYANLSAAEQTQVDNILTNHPKYAVWKAAHTTDAIPLGLHVFMQASTWPDEIRNYNDPTTHADWHFIDYPLRAPFRFRAAPNPDDNVVYGIGKCEDILSDVHTSSQVEAEYLSFLIHFVGDSHQPLHCSTLFDATFNTSEGDRGGNHFYVKMKFNSANPIKLHSLWDALLGTGQDPKSLNDKAQTLMQAHPIAGANGFGDAALTRTPLEWSKESRAIALSAGYKPLPSLDGTKNRPVVLPENYYSNARAIAEKQVVLAGYRLAARIKEVLSELQDGNPI